MCDLSLYQLFLQAVGIVAISILVGGIFLVLGGVEIDLSAPDNDTKKGGRG